MQRPYTASSKNRTFVQVSTTARICNMTPRRCAHQTYDGAHRS